MFTGEYQRLVRGSRVEAFTERPALTLADILNDRKHEGKREVGRFFLMPPRER